MPSLAFLHTLSTLISLTKAFSIPSPGTLVLSQNNNSAGLLVAGPISNSTNVTQLSATAHCDNKFATFKLDKNVVISSCRNAWLKMPRDGKKEVFTKRPAGAADEGIPLPIRYLSDDGFCAIDIGFTHFQVAAKSVIVDTSLSEGVASILVGCVYSTQVGGHTYVPSRLQVTLFY